MPPPPLPTPVTLVADRRQARRRRLRSLLESAGIPVVDAGSLSEALAALEGNETIDAVILGVDLSRRKRPSQMQSIRSARPGVGVVVVADDEGAEAAAGLVEAGAQGYLLESQLAQATLVRTLLHAVERKMAESEMERSRVALLECESRYDTLFDICRVAICVVDPQGVVSEVNRAAVALFGASRPALVGRAVESLFLRAEDREIVRCTVRDRETLSGVEASVRGADGSPAWTLVSVAPARGTGGAYVILQDLMGAERRAGEGPTGAFFDPLTRIPNRALLMDRLNHVLSRRKRREGPSFAVLFVDLDGFKDINDRFGHDVGDELLRQVAGRLSDCIRDEDTVARIGGDEFVILLTQLEAIEDATLAADRVLFHIGRAFKVERREIRISCSVGITAGMYEGGSPDELLRQADYAMYQAKREGRGRYQIYDREMQAQVLRTRNFDAEVRRALTMKEFVVHYQPVVEAESGKLHGFEALVRWNHPERGLVSPADFVPAAMRRGFMEAIGGWVLDEVCRQLEEWLDRYEGAEALVVSVNLSEPEFLRPDFVDDVQRAIRQHHIPAKALRLELTERTLAVDPEFTAHTFRRLRNLGIRVTIDDFGDGASVWGYLERTPVDSLKICGAGRAGAGGKGNGDGGPQAIQRITQFARCLGMSAVAERVETAEELEEYRAAGSSLAQGYFFWKPLEASEAAALLAGQAPSGLDP